MEETNKQQEFKELAPRLKELLDKEQQQATLPKDYFQNFESRLQQRLATEKSLEPSVSTPKKTWRLEWQQLWKPLSALALPALLLLLWVGLSPQEQEPIVDTFAAVSNQEIDQYIEQNLEDFTLTDLLAMAEVEILDAWQEGLASSEATVSLETESTTSSTSFTSEGSLEKALEKTQTDDLLDELTTDDLSLEEDWF